MPRHKIKRRPQNEQALAMFSFLILALAKKLRQQKIWPAINPRESLFIKVSDLKLEQINYMSKLTLTRAFAEYGARLKNPQWSVSAWLPEGTLVVCLWDHHCRKGFAGTMEFSGSLERWSGHGNKEFRENLSKAFVAESNIRLVIVTTKETARVEAGEDASKIKKFYATRHDLIGKITELGVRNYVFQFAKTPIP